MSFASSWVSKPIYGGQNANSCSSCFFLCYLFCGYQATFWGGGFSFRDSITRCLHSLSYVYSLSCRSWLLIPPWFHLIWVVAPLGLRFNMTKDPLPCTSPCQASYGGGSKICTQNRNPGKWKHGLNLWSHGGSILTHTHIKHHLILSGGRKSSQPAKRWALARPFAGLWVATASSEGRAGVGPLFKTIPKQTYPTMTFL